MSFKNVQEIFPFFLKQNYMNEKLHVEYLYKINHVVAVLILQLFYNPIM